MSQTINKSRDFYDEFFYEGRELTYDNQERYCVISELLSLGPISNSSVLDIGAGMGRITRDLSDSHSEVTAIDILLSDPLADLLDTVEVNFSLGALPSLPFDENSFSLVVCSEVIEHLESHSVQKSAIEDIARVLEPGGHFVLSTPNPRSPVKPLRDLQSVLANISGLGRSDGDGDQLVENWIHPTDLQAMICEEMSIQTQRGSFYAPPTFGLPLEGITRKFSDAICSRGLFKEWGLYQYYVCKRPE